MAIEIGLVFTAFDVAKSVAEFAGILDSVSSKLDRLVQSELNAGLRALEQAGRATSERVHLLREARGHFNKAVSNEKGYRQALALLGLAVCHYWLGDTSNSTRTLEEILDINPVTTLSLVTTEGRRRIRDQVRDLNPLTARKRLREQREAMERDIADKGLLQAYQNFFVKNSVVGYGMAMFSERARKEYKRALVLQAVDMNEEASAIRQIQESVSGHVGKPISWLRALE